MSDPLAVGDADARVVVAMSGGVDSSVAAALVKGWGYEAVGVTLQLYDHGAATGKPGACCAGQDIHDARRVADRLGMPHYVLDFEERFRRAVIDDFADGYARGRTPVPCVRCNQRIKFDELLTIARDLGARALVTGHYARRAAGPELRRAADASRDQTYFLFATTREQLAFVRFPLGDMLKERVREHARAFGLGTAAKAESRDICFVPQGHYSDVVKRLRPDAAEPGPVVDLEGRELATHQGLAHFTVGQRRGLGVATGAPVYVLALDPKRRAVVVGPERSLVVTSLWLDEVNWLGEGGLPRRLDGLMVKHRAHEPAIGGRLEASARGIRVIFDAPGFGIAPGQACVLYEGDRVLGGGWIGRVETAVPTAAGSA